MAKPILSLSEIEQLTQLLRNISAATTRLTEKHPLGHKITNHPVPSELSESLAIHLLQKKIILPELAEFYFERKGYPYADIIATTPTRDASLAFEVKASGVSGFQRFSTGDTKADYLIWISFNDYFKLPGKDQAIRVYTLAHPGKIFPTPGYISLTKFLKIAGNLIIATDIAPGSLNLRQLIL